MNVSFTNQLLMGGGAQPAQSLDANGGDFEQLLLQMSDSAVKNDAMLDTRADNQSAPKPQAAGQSKPQQTADANADAGRPAQTSAAEGEQPVEAQELAAAMVTAQPVLPLFVFEQPAAAVDVPQAQVVQVELAEALAEAEFMPEAVRQTIETQTASPVPQGAAQQIAELAQPIATQAEAQAGPNANLWAGADTEQQAADVRQTEQTVPQLKAEEIDAQAAQPAQAPIFARTEAVPVKVAQPEQVLRPEMPDTAEQLMRSVEQAVINGESTVRIDLHPATLGSLTIEISRLADGTLSVALAAATEKAAALLETHRPGLQSLLLQNAQTAVRVEVQNRMEDSPAQQFLNPDAEGDAKQQQQQRQSKEHGADDAQNFLQQLRLGLINLEEAV